MSNLIAKINDPTVNTITIPVTANVSGSTTQPQVQTDLTSGVKNLTQQLIEIQKQKLLNTGKDKINDAINNIIKGNTTTKDSTNTTKNNTVKDVLGGILGNSNTTKDSTKTDSSNTKNPVKDVLGGIFGKKKKSN